MTIPTPFFPPPLKPGDAVALAAPAGAVDEARLKAAAAMLKSRGLRATMRKDIVSRHRYMAGNDERRAEELLDALRNPSVKALFLARGGFGCQRILKLIESEDLDQPKAIIGFSDNTILLNYFRRARGWATLHGPHPDGTNFTDMNAVLACLGLGRSSKMPDFKGLKLWNPDQDKEVWGEISGGCLSLLAASQGAPWAFRAEGRIVFIEDVGEPTYRIDRTLNQLIRSGALDHAKAVIFGQVETFTPGGEDQENLVNLIDEFAQSVSYPVLSGLPCGHGTPNRPLPFGPKALLKPALGTLSYTETFVR